MKKHTVLLHKNWTLQVMGDDQSIPDEIKGRVLSATVPGCVHLDLLDHNLIDDPYHDHLRGSH